MSVYPGHLIRHVQQKKINQKLHSSNKIYVFHMLKVVCDLPVIKRKGDKWGEKRSV